MTDADELKAKMREALDKKEEQEHPSTAEGPADDTSENSQGVEGPIDNPGQTAKHTHGTI
ncbi:DUF5302 family protein [Aeromicrobium sp.]|uniref:DUF5302 family protein n=1 Tax=Aeromicrobium sp. TaxID=1871063 RepID=UPI0028B073D9|nr:DUF5302 family protein [Aeromicrobium sp.]